MAIPLKIGPGGIKPEVKSKRVPLNFSNNELCLTLREQTSFSSEGSCHRSWSSWSQVGDGLKE